MNNIKDNNIKDIIKRDSVYYMDNHNVLFFANKLQKINIAIYVVTNFLSDNEPIKFSLREKNLKLMSYIMSLITDSVYINKESISKINFLIFEIDSLLKISLNSNLISSMNYLILSEEYKNFSNIVNENILSDKKIILDKNFFEEQENILDDNYINKEQDYKGQSKGHIFKKDTDNIINRNIKDKIKKEAKVIKDTKIKVNDRRNFIINIIKKKKEITVKDLSKVIRDCSEKTLQRELVNMVTENVLKKEGERRWSRYSLI